MPTANEFIQRAVQFIGHKESDGSHREIIDIYNNISPLPVGYRVKYSDSWCAAFVSAVAWLTRLDPFPFECSCERMIRNAEKLGMWIEDETITPQTGDVIMYDWQDAGRGDNVGWADHTGIVESVESGVVNVIEGNINDAVGRRRIAVNARYIRGYIRPRFAEQDEFFPAYKGKKTYSIVDALSSLGINSTFAYRKKIAKENGITFYVGTAKQNLEMLSLLQFGQLKKPK